MNEHNYRDINRKLDRILAILTHQHYEVKEIMATLDDLQAQVTSDTSLDSSIVTLIQGLAAQVAAAGADPAKLAAIIASMKQNAQTLADAAAANTPAATA